MPSTHDTERVETIVIGAGQAGLSVGYHLARRGRTFLILDANQRVGDSWRGRWDSLRLFTPARFDGLAGMPFPAAPHYFPTKNEMADFLEAYATRFDLPIRHGIRVDRLTREGDRYVVAAGERRFEAGHVVVAMANYQQPRLPSFSRELEPRIVQLHSSAYRNPAQIRDGGVLIVGAGNSGSEIAMELARSHSVSMSGRDTGHVPFRIEGLAGRLLMPFLFRVVFHRILSVRTPIGRRVRPKVLGKGGPLIRVKPRDLEAAGVARVGRTIGVRDGLPLLEGERVLEVANVIWCTGFMPGFSWIQLPGVDGGNVPHEEGIVPGEPGLYFVGQHFLYAMSSTMIHGVGRDAERIARTIAARAAQTTRRAAAPRAVATA